jgi:acyl-ACP thioesterase
MLQETAWQHASMLGKGYADREAGELFWVLSRLRMQLDALPCWGDEFAIRTQPIGVERLFALREFEIVDADTTPIGRVMTAWLLVDAGRGRPVRPEKRLADIPLGEPEYAADMTALPGPEAGDAESGSASSQSVTTLTVQPHDIDQYNHVNNASYLEWVMDALGSTQAGAATIDIDFIKETVLGEQVSVRLLRNGSQTLSEIRRVPAEEPVARIRLFHPPSA